MEKVKNSAALKARILIIDDDADIRAMMTAVLEGAGATVAAASSAAEALNAISSNSFDAAVLDWHLGGSTGEELLASLKAEHPNLFDRTAVVTGDILSSGDDNTAARLGRPLLAKPFRPRQLIETLTALIS
jgi:two-component system chemotaxis response regulator CheY